MQVFEITISCGFSLLPVGKASLGHRSSSLDWAELGEEAINKQLMNMNRTDKPVIRRFAPRTQVLVKMPIPAPVRFYNLVQLIVSIS